MTVMTYTADSIWNEERVGTARVHASDMPMLCCARAMLSLEIGIPTLPLERILGKPADRLSSEGADLLKTWIRRSVPRLLARFGGGLIRPWPENGTLVRQPLWQRESGKHLDIDFDQDAWNILRWLAHLEPVIEKEVVTIAPVPPSWAGKTGQAFFMWRLVDTLGRHGACGAARDAALEAWAGHHLPLWLGHPLVPTREGSKPWSGWLQGGWLTQLEGCQSWLCHRWEDEIGDMVTVRRNPDAWLCRLEKICERGRAWLKWSSSAEGRWDLAGPLYRALCPGTLNGLLETMDRLKPEMFSAGLSQGQVLANRLGVLASLFEEMVLHHQHARSRLYFDEDHAAAQALLHQVSHLPGTEDFENWAGHVMERVRAAQIP